LTAEAQRLRGQEKKKQKKRFHAEIAENAEVKKSNRRRDAAFLAMSKADHDWIGVMNK
jgi:hypothetical protein